MKLAVNNPNLTILTPSTCDSKCSFCFGYNDKVMADKVTYLSKLKYILENLPQEFEQISISGGEPTLCSSPYLEEIIGLIDKSRYPKLVLTTSGTLNGKICFDNIVKLGKIDHINISRHEVDDVANRKIFNNTDVPDIEMLRKVMIPLCNMHGIDVTLNCVMMPGTRIFDIDIGEYIDMAKYAGASACCFRKIQDADSDLFPTYQESRYSEWKVVSESSCPVCRSKSQLINGMKVTWKASLLEPSNAMNGVYELIYHPNAMLTSDWGGKQIIRHLENFEEKTVKELPKVKKSSVGGTGEVYVGCNGLRPRVNPSSSCGSSGGCGKSTKSTRANRALISGGRGSCGVPSGCR